MAVRRKVFRIEQRERTPMGARGGMSSGIDLERTGRAAKELRAIVECTGRATQDILAAAEGIAQSANSLESETRDAAIRDIRQHAVAIFEACNFHDITGQRVAHVMAVLKSIEGQAGRLLADWRAAEQREQAARAKDESDSRFLNGPKLRDDAGHSSQDDIDSLFTGN